MIPRTTARRLLRELPSPAARASRPLQAAFSSAIRPFTTTPPSRAQIPPRTPQPNIPTTPQQQAAAAAALQNLSHLTPAQITSLLSAAPTPPPPPGGHAQYPNQPHQQPPPRSRREILVRRALWALFFFAAGYKLTTEQIASLRVATPFLYPPVEVSDPADLAAIRMQVTLDAVHDSPLLQSMFRSVRGGGGGGDGAAAAVSDWENWEPYESFPADRRRRHLCAGPLDNPNALGLVHHVFRHRYTGELVLAVVFGQGTSGWPSVVHGGMLSTVMDEAMGRLAALAFPANTAVTARLSVEFREPATPGVVYVVRVGAALPEHQEPAKADRKTWVFGRMEGPDGETVCEAKALFVVPRDGAQPLGRRF